MSVFLSVPFLSALLRVMLTVVRAVEMDVLPARSAFLLLCVVYLRKRDPISGPVGLR